MKAIVAERGQITIPKAIRDSLGLTPGVVLNLREENGRIVAEKAPLEDPFSKVLGCLPLDKSTDEILADLRDAR
ncbi:MAG: AbrB/MazE/SpoVT family DNA-binding domain-containing protein [Candidatus Hydrogenedentales bacterium]|jgi:AbrB family looped-hinge helix DNA binding protein